MSSTSTCSVYIILYRRHEPGTAHASRSYHWAIALANSATAPGKIGNWYQIDRDTTGRSWVTTHGSGYFAHSTKMVGFVRLPRAGLSTADIRARIDAYAATQGTFVLQGEPVWTCAQYCIRLVEDLRLEGLMNISMTNFYSIIRSKAIQLEDRTIGEEHDGLRVTAL